MPNPFMEMEQLTPWHAVGEVDGHRVIVCDDLNPAGYDKRLLVVIEGLPDPGGDQRAIATQLLMTVVTSHVSAAMGYKFEGIDDVRRAVPGHWHLQANLRR